VKEKKKKIKKITGMLLAEQTGEIRRFTEMLEKESRGRGTGTGGVGRRRGEARVLVSTDGFFHNHGSAIVDFWCWAGWEEKAAGGGGCVLEFPRVREISEVCRPIDFAKENIEHAGKKKKKKNCAAGPPGGRSRSFGVSISNQRCGDGPCIYAIRVRCAPGTFRCVEKRNVGGQNGLRARALPDFG